MKVLHLTGITTAPNAKGTEKIAKANGKKTGEDAGTLSREWFIENNLKPPMDSEDEVERDEWGQIILDPEDVDEVGIAVSIPLKYYAGAEASTDGTSIIYTSYSYQFSVFESIEEIDDYVEYLTSPWHIRAWASIKVDWYHFKRRLRGIKKVSLEEILSRPENQPDYIAEKD